MLRISSDDIAPYNGMKRVFKRNKIDKHVPK